jgi:prolyl-tRNA synthetase
MRLSRYFLNTLREVPAEAEVASHKLMLRAGMIRKLAAGIYDLLPLGLRAQRKVEAIIREEMDRAGAQEVLLPAVQPAELWQETGRWAVYGKELLRVRDRHEREFCVGPTHEEVITDLVRREVRSYRQLPVTLYQIQAKFRDEIRPRFGLMRGREFFMKDAYSFDRDDKGAEASYQAMRQAYTSIFSRCGLKFAAVEADTGQIGGSLSHEFMVLADTGEDRVVSCAGCGYAANLEKAEVKASVAKPATGKGGQPNPSTPSTGSGRGASAAAPAPRKVPTPGKHTVEEVAEFLKVTPQQVVKTIIFSGEKGVVGVLVRGDHEANPVKVRKAAGDDTLELAAPDVVAKASGAPLGFAGPVGAKYPLYADHAISCLSGFVVGGNEKDMHLTGVDLSHFSTEMFADLREACEGDPCPRCGGKLAFLRGIEVGHIFYLGDKYSAKMKAAYLDETGAEKTIVMGCYGIGVGRTVASAIEQNHDEKGIIWPAPIAPFHAALLCLDPKVPAIASLCDQVYDALWKEGIEVLYDDRDERPGVKFNDADLLGLPVRITVGKKSAAEGLVELRVRATGAESKCAPAELPAKVRELLKPLP